jgi:hypothetical protein
MLLPLFDKGTLTADAYADLNDITKTCIVQAKDNTANKPESGSTYYIVLTIVASHYNAQIAIEVLKRELWIRSFVVGQGWKVWFKVN